MPKPQQPELARNRLGSTDQDGKELRRDDDKSLRPAERGLEPVPVENQAGHRPDNEQDKPDGPPSR
jgi:hypothetical protein